MNSELIPTNLDALIVAPHPDDAELGMGGAILGMLKAGLKIGILDLTNGEPTPFGSPEIRARETNAASDVLGVTWRHNLGLPNRSLEPTLDAREKLAGIFRQTKPRWIFAPYWQRLNSLRLQDFGPSYQKRKCQASLITPNESITTTVYI